MNNNILLKNLFEDSKNIIKYIKKLFNTIKLSNNEIKILYPYIYNKFKIIFSKIKNKDKDNQFKNEFKNEFKNVLERILNKYHLESIDKKKIKLKGGLQILLDNKEIIDYIMINNQKIIKNNNNNINKIKLFFNNIINYLDTETNVNKDIKNKSNDKNIIIYFNYLINKEDNNNIVENLFNKLFFNHINKKYAINKNEINIELLIQNIEKIPVNLYILLKIIKELIYLIYKNEINDYEKKIILLIIILYILNLKLKYNSNQNNNTFELFITFFFIHLINSLLFL